MSRWIIALTVILPTLLEVIDTSVVNVSLDHIRGSLSAGIDEATWTITAYLVANAIIIPMTGWLSRLFGRKRYLMFSVTLFTFASFLCGSAHSLSALVFYRILQGIGGGGLQPLSQAILLETFPPAKHGIAMAVYGIGILVGPIVGPVLGGWITDNWSWPWIFYINIPLGLLSIIMTMFFITDPPYLRRVDIREKIDYWGLGLIVVGIGCLQVVLDKGQREDWFSSAFIMRLSVIAVVALIAFVIAELRTKDPILNLRALKNVAFASANMIQFIAFFSLFGSIILLPIFVQQLLGYTSFLAGMVLAPGGVATLLLMPIVGLAVTRINPKAILICGITTMAYSMFMMTQFNLSVDYDIVAWSRIIMGVGMGMIMVPLMTMAFATVKKEEMANATSIFSLVRNIAGSFGVAIMTTILARRVQFHQARLSEQANPYDTHYQLGLNKAMAVLGPKAGAVSEHAASGLIFQEMMRQANLFSFNDAFHIASIMMICVVPLVFLLKRPRHDVPAAAVH